MMKVTAKISFIFNSSSEKRKTQKKNIRKFKILEKVGNTVVQTFERGHIVKIWKKAFESKS